MTRDEFEALVKRLEREVDEQPHWYRAKLCLLALLGYAYILGILAALVGAVFLLAVMVSQAHGAAYVAGKIGWVLLILIWVICRSLWITLPEPQGVEIRPEQAPELFRRLDRVQTALGGPSLSSVIIVGDFNASITQLPRLGIFGWNRNILALGWPLLLALNADQCEAVVAHEFGHLSSSHGRFAAWVYRIRTTWFALMESLKQETGVGGILFGRFFSWYAPAFGAYSFVLARRHEFDADRLGADLVGAAVSGQALIGTCLWNAALDELFWNDFQKGARLSPEPPLDLYAAMERFFRSPPSSERLAHWLRISLQVKTTSEDTHPSLRERLQALGLGEEGFAPVPVPGARQLFSPEACNEVVEQLNAAWREQVRGAWKLAHDEFQAQRTRLEDLRRHPSVEELPLNERMEHAFLTEIVDGGKPAEALYAALLQEHPDHPMLVYTRARLLLEAGDGAGIELMEKATAMDSDSIIHACELVVRFFIEQERRDEAEPWIKRAQAEAEIIERDREERQHLPFEKVYQPHDVDSAALTGVIEALRGHPEIVEAFFVQRTLTVRPQRPLFVLGIRLRVKWYQYDDSLAEPGERICGELAGLPVYPGETSILALHGHNKPLKPIFEAIPGAKIAVF